jgi:hypothetical protein
VPLLLAHNLSIGRMLFALPAFSCFSLTASATYIVNDLLLGTGAEKEIPERRLGSHRLR